MYKAEKLEITNKFEDARGIIENITPPEVIKDMLRITGVKGAVRGNHYHKEDTHYCYIESGEILYEWQDPDSEEVHSQVLVKGDYVVSRPLQKHRFTFLEDGVFYAFATKSRKQEAYETDTVRVEF